jgi:hypothetical protein
MSITYNLTKNEKWKLNSSFGKYYKIPPYTILGYRNIEGSLVNKKSKYIRSNHIVLGLEHLLNKSSRLTLEGFYKKYSQYPISLIDKVSLANKGGGFEILGNEEIISSGQGESIGIEILFQQKLSKNFYGTFAYTFFNSQFTDLSGKYLPSVWDSRHLISFSGGYKLKKNWEISSRWRFSGKTPYVPVNLNTSLESYPELILNYNELGNKKLTALNLLDVRFDKKWNLKRYSLNLYVEIQNLLAQTIPRPEEYGLNRSSSGELIFPNSLVEIDVDENNNIPIPTIGFVVYF